MEANRQGRNKNNKIFIYYQQRNKYELRMKNRQMNNKMQNLKYTK